MMDESLIILSDESEDEYIPLWSSDTNAQKSPPRDIIQSPTVACYLCPDLLFLTEIGLHLHNRKQHPEIHANYSFLRRKCRLCNTIFKSLTLRGLVYHIVNKKCEERVKRRNQNKLQLLSALSLVPAQEVGTENESNNISECLQVDGGKNKVNRCNSFLCKSQSDKIMVYCKSCRLKNDYTELDFPSPTPHETVFRPPPIVVPLQPSTNKRGGGSNWEKSDEQLINSVLTTSRASARRANEKICRRTHRKLDILKRKANKALVAQNSKKTQSTKVKPKKSNENEGRLFLRINKQFWDSVKKTYENSNQCFNK